MTTMPETLQIGTATFRVTTDPEEYKKENSAYGWTDPVRGVIGVNPESDPSVQRLSLWHEILHAVHATVMGDPSWAKMPKNPSSAEELVVRRWEHPTLAVLRDNPELVMYLMEGAWTP